MAEEVMAKQAAAVVAIKSKGAVALETLQGVLKAYTENMDVKRATTPDEGVEHQTKLLRAIKGVLRLEGQDFVQAWQVLSDWVYKNRNGCMGPRYRNRWQDLLVAIPVSDRNFLERIVHFLCQTCDPMSRSAVLQRYDWGRIHRCLSDDLQVEKIKGFYAQFGH